MNLIRKTLLLFSVVGIAFLNSCNKDNEGNNNGEQNIIGVWKITSASVDFSVGDVSLVDYLVEALGISETEAQSFETAINEGFVEGFDGSIEFKSDHTYVAEFGDDPAENGTWELLEGGTKMKLKADGETEITEIDIKSITAIAMTVEFAGSDSEDLDDDGTNEVLSILVTMNLQKQ